MEEKRKRTKKSIIIFLAILGGMLVLGIVGKLAGIGAESDSELSGAESVKEKYIGVLFIEGEIFDDSSTYNHEYALDAIDGMMKNDKNEGLMLYIETPGGGVYESDELYLKIKEYKETTQRPVYAYLGVQATSGGYYIATSADSIMANRNCWTGSIGVLISNIYDISGLMEKYGIKSVPITSGKNKTMGDITQPMTEEQRQIFQSIVDEAFDQFVDVVAEERNLDEAYVRQIADGRIYTAKQAEKLKLIDGIINTYDDAIKDMKAKFSIHDYDCEVYEFRYEKEYDIFNGLIQSIDRLAEASSGGGDIKALTELIKGNNELPLQYMCEVRK